jgi:hypothetical protein
MTSTLTLGTLGSAALNYGNFDRKHKPWNIVSSERYIIHMQVLLHINGKFTMGKLEVYLLLLRFRS